MVKKFDVKEEKMFMHVKKKKIPLNPASLESKEKQKNKVGVAVFLKSHEKINLFHLSILKKGIKKSDRA